MEQKLGRDEGDSLPAVRMKDRSGCLKQGEGCGRRRAKEEMERQ